MKDFLTALTNFFNSNFFVAFVTLLVGSVAFVVYKKQKGDTKKDAALLITQEVRFAEQQIRTFLDIGSYHLANKLLPTNSWHKNIHLFVQDLKESELDIISKFYANAAYIDVVIGKISDKKNDILIPVEDGQAQKAGGDEDIKTFQLNATKILEEVSGKVEFIYNTPAINKLTKIAEGKKL